MPGGPKPGEKHPRLWPLKYAEDDESIFFLGALKNIQVVAGQHGLSWLRAAISMWFR